MSRPWMPLYVADYLADTGHLSCAEHGAYLLLIMHYWQKGGLPDDDKRLANIARASLEQWSDIRPALLDFFEPGWRHHRIDTELAEAEKKYQARANAGKKGGEAKAAAAKQSASNATAELYQPQPPSQASTKQGADAPNSSEAETAPSAVALLPTVSEGEVPIFAADVAEWRLAFPAVDIQQQLGAMRSWLIANPTKRKTKRGMRKFVVSWLDRKQNNSGPAPPRNAAPMNGKRMNASEAYQSFYESGHEPVSAPNSHGDVEFLPPRRTGLPAPAGDIRQGTGSDQQ